MCNDAAPPLEHDNRRGLLRQAQGTWEAVGLDACYGRPEKASGLAGMRGQHQRMASCVQTHTGETIGAIRVEAVGIQHGGDGAAPE
jgi:hypothetical protein